MHALALCGLLAAAAPAAPTPELVRLPNGNVTLRARFAPLGTLIRQFEAVAPIDISLVDPKVSATQVSVAVEDVPVAVALSAMLDAAGVAYAVWGDDPKSVRVVAFPTGGGPPEPAPPRPPVTEPTMLPSGVIVPPGISPDDPDLAMIGGPPPPRETPPEDDPELAEILGPPPDPGDGRSPEGATKGNPQIKP
jgi:hypothetical protein